MGVTIGAYLAVMQVLGVEEDLNFLLKDDPFGHQLQDAKLSPRKTRSKRTAPSDNPHLTHVEPNTESDWAKDDFLSAGSLASLLHGDENVDKKNPKRTKK